MRNIDVKILELIECLGAGASLTTIVSGMVLESLGALPENTGIIIAVIGMQFLLLMTILDAKRERLIKERKKRRINK